ncbi:MAG: FISUMP domain-containing protein [Calditrichia bacterium]
MKKALQMIVICTLVLACSTDPDLTKSEDVEPDIVTDIDGNEYQTIQIGSQVWMAEDLRVTRYRDGTKILNLIDSSDWSSTQEGAYASYENNDANGVEFGLLYNGLAVEDVRNIAPEGWRVPTDKDWKILETHLGISIEELDVASARGAFEGGMLKEIGTSHWNNPNVGATNETFFTARPGGQRQDDGSYDGLGLIGWFWSVTRIQGGTNLWQRTLQNDNAQIGRGVNSPQHGRSIRCIKETAGPAGSPLQEDKITPFDALVNNRFGHAVSIDGSFLAVSAISNDRRGPAAGSAYIFERVTSGWSEKLQLLPDLLEPGDELGRSIGCGDGWVIVGADGDDDRGKNAGAVYIYRNATSGWEFTQKLTAPNGAPDDRFGVSCAINNQWAVVGAFAQDSIAMNSGSVYIYRYNTGAQNWGFDREIVAPTAREGAIFGNAVSLSGNQIVIGASMDDELGDQAGAAYVFEHEVNEWSFKGKLVASDGMSGANFGASVAIDGDDLIVGSPKSDGQGDNAGSIYFFEKQNNVWQESGRYMASSPAASDEFGGRVDISGEIALIGSTGKDITGENSGAAYIFRKDGDGWKEIEVICASDGASSNSYGDYVAIDGNYAVVGAPQSAHDGASSGIVYIYTPLIQN